MTTGQLIKKLRLEKNLSQEKLGELIGVQKSAIRKYEKDEVTNIKKEVMIKLSKVLGISPNQLIQWDSMYDTKAISNEVKLIEKIQEQYGKQAVELLSIFSKLNDAGKSKVIELASDLSELDKYIR